MLPGVARLAPLAPRLTHGAFAGVVANKPVIGHRPLVDPEPVQDLTRDLDKLLQRPFSPLVAILVFPR